MQIPLDPRVKYIVDLPYTLTMVIRKRQQIDSLNELPKDKRPPDSIIWDGSSRDLDKWLEDVMGNKEKENPNVIIRDIDIEG